jgi:cytochrome c
MNKNCRFIYHLIVVASFTVFLIACSKSEQENKGQDTSGTKVNPETIPAPAEAINEPLGLKLMKASDCFSCHQQDVNLVGPSYKMIKEKYPLKDANVTDLTDKVIKGSVGVWGQVVMPSHPNLKKEDAEEMVRYILSL